MYLSLHDLLAHNTKGFLGSTVISITLRDYAVAFNLMPAIVLEISEYWEMRDSQDTLVDRALSAEKRENFMLFKLIGQKVQAVDKQLDTFIISFGNGLKFLIYYDPRAQQDEQERERRRIREKLRDDWDGV